MRPKTTVGLIGLALLGSGTVSAVWAQQPQIPTLQVCNETQVQGKALVKVQSRADATHSGSFKIALEVKCNREANNGYPAGVITITELSMSDSIAQGTIAAVSLEQVTSTGKHTPTVYINGRCRADHVIGCRFWLMIADNKKANDRGTPDVVSFLVFNSVGQRVAYGTGPVAEGDIQVAPTSN